MRALSLLVLATWLISPVPVSHAGFEKVRELHLGDITCTDDELSAALHSNNRMQKRACGLDPYSGYRPHIEVSSQVNGYLDGHVLVARVPSFYDRNAADALKNLLVDSRQRGVRAVVLVFWGNGGGYLAEMSEMLCLFVRKPDPFLYARGGDGTIISYSPATQGDIGCGGNVPGPYADMDLFVVMDGNTASASILFIWGLPHVVTVGKPSGTKASIQTLVDADNGHELWVTWREAVHPEQTEDGNGLLYFSLDGMSIEPDYPMRSSTTRPSATTFARCLAHAVARNEGNAHCFRAYPEAIKPTSPPLQNASLAVIN